MKLTKIKIEVVAIETGYYNNRIVPSGQKFEYDGVLKDGKLPLWVKAVGAFPEEKAEKKTTAKVKKDKVEDLV